MRRLLLSLIVCAALAPAAALARPAARPHLTVYAAASLTNVFPRIDPYERYSFGGSNMLEAQIQQGAPADVFAAANTTLPAQLHAAGLCSKPVVFTRNTLVIVVPKSNPAGIHSVYDLARSGIKLVVAAAGVPVGDYTLQVLGRLSLTGPVLKNVVSQETDVREVLAKVALGEADAGFVYSTDARTVRGRVAVVGLPARAQPRVQYGVCVVATGSHRSAGRAFVRRLLGRAAQTKLLAAGFLSRRGP